MNPIILHDYPEADYHSQTGEKTPLFSYSTAKVLLEKSAYHAYLQHPLLGNEPRKPTAAMDKGSIIHGLLLGGGPEIEIIQADNFRTKVAQTAKTEAYEAGKIPMLQKEMDNINVAVACIKAYIQILVPYFFDKHESELSVRWTMDNGVETQTRFDHITPETGKIIELKSCSDANPKVLDRKIIDFGYDIQEALYLQCANKAWPEMAGRFTWEFIFVEPEPPYMVSVITTDSSMSWLGESKIKRASDKWAECLESGIWPGYGRQVVSAPPWAVSREEMEEEL